MNALILLLTVGLCHAATPATAPAEPFAYEHPIKLELREVPPQESAVIPHVNQRQINFKNTNGHEVPVLISIPEGKPGPFRTILLLHGFGGNKEQVTAQVGKPFLMAGYACIAPDMPLHGQRPGSYKDYFTSHFAESYRLAIEAVTDSRQTIDLAETRKDLSTKDGIALVGFSMGT